MIAVHLLLSQLHEAFIFSEHIQPAFEVFYVLIGQLDKELFKHLHTQVFRSLCSLQILHANPENQVAIAFIQLTNQCVITTLAISVNQLLIAVLGNISAFSKEQRQSLEKKLVGLLWNHPLGHISMLNTPVIDGPLYEHRHKKGAEG